ncbi:hypothetical protein ISCGN_010986 [Ixodes scapularis]
MARRHTRHQVVEEAAQAHPHITGSSKQTTLAASSAAPEASWGREASPARFGCLQGVSRTVLRPAPHFYRGFGVLTPTDPVKSRRQAPQRSEASNGNEPTTHDAHPTAGEAAINEGALVSHPQNNEPVPPSRGVLVSHMAMRLPSPYNSGSARAGWPVLSMLPAAIPEGTVNEHDDWHDAWRCFHCQRFGHSAQSCRGKTTCAKCGQNDHPSDNCANPPHCVNCGEPHAAYSRSCKKWEEEKEVIILKVKENISFPEARKRLSFLQKGSFATVTRTGGVSPKTSVGTQVCPKDLAVPPTPPAPPRSAPRPRLSLEPKGSRCLNGAAAPLLKEAMDTMAPKEVSPPKASGVVPLAPPSVLKEGPSQTTSSKELERTPSSSARSSGRGRALPTPASTSSRKPGQLDEAYSTASQQSVDEMMDESMPPSDDDLVPSGHQGRCQRIQTTKALVSQSQVMAPVADRYKPKVHARGN